jgi:glycosyltransferase involved in cell wall biosynthesis
VRQVLATGAGRRARSTLQDVAHRRAERPHVGLCLGSPGPTTVLLDLEAAWNDPIPRTRLLDRFSRAGARSAAMIADVLPVLHPEWFDSQLLVDFDTFLDGHLAHSDLFLCISERTRKDLLLVAEQRGVTRELHTCVIPLGSDLGPDAPTRAATAVPSSVPGDEDVPATRGRYLLTVGTIEPRKNQGLSLDVFDALAERHPDLGLVLVGKRGWKVDQLIRRIETDRYHGGRLLWLEEVDDDRLARLYRGATLALAPARYEGLGMTVMESLRLGTPVIASSGGALPEAGGDAAEYAHPDDTAAWVGLVERHLDDPAHHDAAIRRVAAHQLPTWDGAAAAVTAAMADAFGPGRPTP